MTEFEKILYRLPAILIALTIHELAHGWVAYKLGDSTAKDSGRLTLNPLSHLDPLGTIMLIFSPFGWAKPVPVNGYNLKNPKRDLLYISAAGPVSNIILAVTFGVILHLISSNAPQLLNYPIISISLHLGVMINLGLAFFNLLPMPPLDGSKIMMGILPNRYLPGYINISKHVPAVFITLIVAEWAIPGINIFSRIINPLFIPFYYFWMEVITTITKLL
ncbi:membrane metalloprotease [Chitinispirillum alkaliphilum]|nr:membrane metalloprotease [Chitinispirillum alkaliphilum]